MKMNKGLFLKEGRMKFLVLVIFLKNVIFFHNSMLF